MAENKKNYSACKFASYESDPNNEYHKLYRETCGHAMHDFPLFDQTDIDKIKLEIEEEIKDLTQFGREYVCVHASYDEVYMYLLPTLGKTKVFTEDVNNI